MKITVDYSYFIQAIEDYDPNHFSSEALQCLYGWYEELERDTGEEIELDVVAICCDWHEYDSAMEALSFYTTESLEDIDEDDRDNVAIELLQEHTNVLWTPSGSVVVMNY